MGLQRSETKKKNLLGFCRENQGDASFQVGLQKYTITVAFYKHLSRAFLDLFNEKRVSPPVQMNLHVPLTV